MKRHLFKRFLLLSAAIAAVSATASARQPERGYRGFADWTNRYARHSDGYWNYTNYYTGFSTTPEGMHILVPTGIFRQWNQSYFSFRVGIDF